MLLKYPVPRIRAYMSVKNPIQPHQNRSIHRGHIHIKALFALSFLVFALCALPFASSATGLGHSVNRLLANVYSRAVARSSRATDSASFSEIHKHASARLANHAIPAAPPSVITITPATVPTATDNDYTRINNAVQAASSGDTIKLAGTFNWTEANAAASWALGSDGLTGGSNSNDDYSIVPPTGLNNVTFTADNLGDATIQGPGDLAGVNLEGVFAFNGPNQNWTISNIRFQDFDLSIGMFATGATDFNNTHIVNNYIRIAKDLNATVAPADVNQNVGIYFSFGTNQLISGNTIEIQGDGVSDAANNHFATDVGMQCDTSGGTAYDGLQITNNTIRVLHAQDATNPQKVLGIWENSWANQSNITVSGNTFVNMDNGNNAATNLQVGFQITSHSSATTTVSYLNNTVSGAHVGFQWLAGADFTGNQPVKLSGNTITKNATGVLVQSHGVANVSFNRIVGNSVGLNNIDGLVNEENNWWGCNAGPGNAGCDSVTGAADFNPWIVLGVSATSTTPGGNSTVTADMTHNSGNVVPAGVTVLPLPSAAFSAINGTIAPPTNSFTAGQSQATFTSTSTGNGAACADVDNQHSCATVTLALPSFAIDNVSHSEGNSGTTSFIFTVTKTGTTTFNATVDYNTVNGTATAPTDYTAISTPQTLSFASNESSKTITVAVNGDLLFEPDETFTVHLSNVDGATISAADGTGTILNDDTPCVPPNTVYVDDDWASTVLGTDPDGAGPATNFGCDSFATIHEGINGVAAGGTVIVRAGTYAENVLVNKSVTLLGPNSGIDPNTGSRGAEAIVMPAVTETSVQGSTSGTVFRVGANSGHVDATIKGFTIDGHNSLLSGGRTLNGVQIDTGAGIVNSTGSFDTNPGAYDATMTIQNNIIQNLERYGVLADNTPSRAPVTGTDVSHNKFDNLPSGNNFGGGRGRAIAFEENLYGSATFNVMTRVNVGWQDDNYNLASPGAATSVSDNEIHTYHRGIFHNLQYQNASDATISNNRIFAETNGDFPASTTNFGVELLSIQSAVGATVLNNSSTGNVYGILLSNLPTTANITISGGTLSGNNYGVMATSNDPQFGAAAASHSIVSGITISGATTAGIQVDNSANIAATALEITGNTSITGSPKAVAVVGAGASANIHDNSSSIHDNPVGISVDGGSANITNNNLYNNATSLQFADNANVIAHFNRIISPTTAIDNPGNLTTLNLENNWWGCNAGPANAGCGTVNGTGADFDPWIVLGVSASPSPIAPFANSTVTADMTHDSGGNVPGAVTGLPLPNASFTAPSNGTIAPPTNSFTAGQSQSTFTSNSNSPGTACAKVDNQQVCTTIVVPLPSLSIDNVSLAEGNSGTTTFTFTVTKTGVGAASVNFQTQDGTATIADNDYQSSSGTLTFASGDTTKPITVLVNGDTTTEPNETFKVHLFGESGATISNADGTGTIKNDDFPCPTALTVNSSADDVDVNPGDHVCETAPENGICTLRAAIQEANLSCQSSVTINFDANVFVPPSSYGILLTDVLPPLQKNISIVGPGARTVSIDGQGGHQIFQIDPGFITSISGLTITNGHTTDGSGGGILNNGTLTLSDSVVSNNSASRGGGIDSEASSSLIVKNTIISGNSATKAGGGIRSVESLKLVNSVVINNTASKNGGGIHNDVNDGLGPASAIITNSTIVGNLADADNTGNDGLGGGLYNNLGTVKLVNTIVAFNALGNQSDNDIGGTDVNAAASSHNLIGTGGSGGLTDGVNGNQVGVVDPMLDPSGVPAAGSPAINKGDNCVLNDSCAATLGFNVTTDQRGVARPQGPQVDIGAFELVAFVVNTTADHDDGACEALSPGHDCTLREAILAANANPNSMIIFGIPGSDSGCDVNSICTIRPTTDLPQITAPVFIDGYSQAGAHPNTKHLNEGDDAVLTIVVNGENDNSASSHGLDLEEGSDLSTIRGLVINHWNSAGIFIQDSNVNAISGNFIGTDAAGASSGGGTGAGIIITSACTQGSAGNLIGGDLPEARNIISGNGAAGIDLGAVNGSCVEFNSAEGNYIGTDRTGKLALANATHGVIVENGSEFNIIGCEVLDGDNLISGNTDAGVYITETDSCLVEGDFIGTDCTGTVALPNKRGVVMTNSFGNQIGLPGFGNVISGNTLNGIEMIDVPAGSCDNNFVQGNLIGTDVTGTVALGNGQSGVLSNGSDCNLIGGGNDGEANLISGNGDEGVALLAASFNIIQGNFIGTDINGTAALGNVGHGVEVYINPPVNSTNNVIGGDQMIAGERAGRAGTRRPADTQAAVKRLTAATHGKISVAVAKRLAAVASAKDLASALSPQNFALATVNRRTSAVQSRTPKLHSSSVRRQNSGPSVQNGSTSNLISGNGGDGVRISSDGDFNNLISQNSIFSNGALGINLGTDGVTPNNSANHATGPNHYQNFPVINSADPNTQHITYTFDTTGGTGPFTIEFFVNDVCDGTNGEGKTFLGSTSVEADGTFDFFPPTPFTAGQIITATATDSNSNTSEFSPCFCTATPATPTASNGGPYCEGATIQLSSPAVAGATYSWTGPNGFSANQQNPTRTNITTADAGTYFVTVAVNGCPSAPGSTNVAVNPVPAAPTAANTGPYFVGQTIKLSASTVAGATYSWTGPNGFTSSLQNPTKANATTADSGDYSVTVTVGGCTSAQATTNVQVGCVTSFTVNDSGDGHDATPGDSVCATSGAVCTLRAAIEEANALPACGVININFSPAVSLITVGSQLVIDHDVNINGATANSLTISGNNATRVFTVNNGRTVSISSLTLTGGNGSGGDGGAIQNNGALTLNGDTLNANSAVNGGAIRSDGTVALINTTISGNSANVNGGGLYNALGSTTLTAVTVAYNRSDNDNNASGSGGGVFVAGGNVLLHNTIVSDNYKGGNPSTTADDIGGAVDSSSSYNLIGSGGSGGVTDGINHNQVGVATALLAQSLMNNGGKTFTLGLTFKSPAINTGDPAVVNSPTFLTVDQRGLPRPADGDNDGTPGVDIGAYQRQATEARPVSDGTNVFVDLVDVRLTFTGVSGAAQESVQLTVNSIPPDAPPGTRHTFDLHPTSNFYTPPVSVCFYLPFVNDPPTFNSFTIYHRENGVFVPHTAHIDFPNRTVCVNDITSFSQFIVNQPVAPTATNGTVNGQILDNKGQPVEGAAVRISGTQNRLTITDAAGNYHFDDVETNGFYVISPSRANFTFSPSQKSFSQLGAHTEAAFTGTANGGGANPLDTTEYFVRQQYLDFLGREPDESGFNFWVNNIESCGTDMACREVKRVDTSAAFFLSIEFQQTGYLVYRTYESAYGNPDGVPVPLKLNEFNPDTREISNGVVVLESGWQQKLENNKRSFMSDFVQRARFTAAYPLALTPAEFVARLFANAHVDATDPDYDSSIAEFAGATDTSDVAARARVLRRIAENSTLTRAQFNQAFVLMEYFGYLRRDPNSGKDTDFTGYNFWLDKLTQFQGNFDNAEMVKAFISATEYRARFPR